MTRPHRLVAKDAALSRRRSGVRIPLRAPECTENHAVQQYRAAIIIGGRSQATCIFRVECLLAKFVLKISRVTHGGGLSPIPQSATIGDIVIYSKAINAHGSLDCLLAGRSFRELHCEHISTRC